MDSVLKLRPEELFFLGDLLDGQYIDYAYVEAMHEIEKNYDAMRAKALEDLARAGIIRKRFSGAVTVMPEAEKLLRNVFGSKVSGEILLGIAGDSVTAVSHRYHFGEDSITEIVTEGGDFTVSEATADSIRRVIAEAVGTHAADARAPEQPDTDRFSRMISAKRAVVGDGLTQEAVHEQDGAVFCFPAGEDAPKTLTDTEAAELLYRTVTGE